MANPISVSELKAFCTAACRQFGYSAEDSAITAEVLVETDMMGVHSHGTKNLLGYLRKTQAGGIRADAAVTTVKEGPGWAMLDGSGGMGMVCACTAMETAIKKAAFCGISMVGIRNSTHFGAAGYYACMAAKRGMIGIAMSNTDPNMTIPGGKGRQIGNSPLAMAVPQKSGEPLFLDIALSAVAALKIEQAKADGRPIPETWAVDRNGYPTTDPADYVNGGSAQPMAAHKGYGLSMMVEILTGVLAGGAYLHDIPSWGWDLPSANKVSHCFLAIDISQFIQPDDFADRLQDYTDKIHASPKRDDTAALLVPGELDNCRYAKALREGLTLPEDVAENLRRLSEMTGIALAL